ncbi:MAG: cbb3-type cytochrome c oxidase subunit I [Methylotenera sp.]|nr:cbb3-type cytochrome c oxidase subunit I [Methylotenera sp.]
MNHIDSKLTNNQAVGGIVKIYIAIAGAVLLLLMSFGVLMKSAQGQIVNLNPAVFYQILTAHGIGMVAIAGFGGAAIMWHFLSKYVKLRNGMAIANLVLFLLGVAMVLASIFIGGFAAAWTFLFPLPSHSMGLWSNHAAAMYMGGVLVVGVGFLLFYLETASAIIREYGSFTKALGWRYLSTGNAIDAPPPAVIASSVAALINIVSILVGAIILVMMLVNLYVPAFKINPLLAKNLIYLFGHVFINAAIYMAVIAVYEILPQYTGRPWKVYKPFVWSWTATCLMALAVYPHHLLMDFAQPLWVHVMGQIVSYTSSLPVLAVTLTGTLGIIYRSGIKWDLTSSLLVLSIFGWSAGVVPAVIDGTIAVNTVMHNTLWVPGHFHLYLLLGCVSMIFAFLSWASHSGQRADFSRTEKYSFGIFLIGATGFVLMFLVSGQSSVPRRWAVHLTQWQGNDQIAAIFAFAVFLAASSIVIHALVRLAKSINTGSAKAG